MSISSNKASRKISYKLDKYISSYSNNNVKVLNPQSSNEINTPQKGKTQEIKNVKIKDKGESFSVYIKGTNYEKTKNARKKEEVDNNKNRLNYYSKSIKTRKNLEAFHSGVDNHRREKSSIDKLNIYFENQEVRSKSRHRELKSPVSGYKATSKIIIDSNGKPQLKHYATKESFNNVEDMIINLNNLKNNLSSNFNKIQGIDSPTNSHVNINTVNSNNQNKRKRNIGEPKYVTGIVFPDCSSSVENSKDRLRKNLKIEIIENINPSDIQISSSKNNYKLLSNNILELENYDDEEDLGRNFELETLGSQKDEVEMNMKNLNHQFNLLNNNNNSFNGSFNLYDNHSNNSTNINPRSLNDNNHNNTLKISSASLNFPKSNSKDSNNILGKEKNRDRYAQFNTNNFQLNFLGDGHKNRTINNSTEIVKKQDMLVLEHMNNSDILNASNNAQTNLKKVLKNNNQNNNKTLKSSVQIISSNATSKFIKNVNPKTKTRTKSFNKSKINNFLDKPFNSLTKLSKIKKTNKSNNTGNLLMSSTNSTNQIPINSNYIHNESVNNQNSYHKNHSIPSIQFIYNSPQFKVNNSRQSSQLPNAKSLLNKNTQGTSNLSNIQNIYHVAADRFSNRGYTLSNVNMNNEVIINTSNTGANSSGGNKQKQNFSNYPLISNIQQIGKLANSNSSSSINNNSHQEKYINNTLYNKLNNSNSSKKLEIISKIDQLDDQKLNKLARVVDELSNNINSPNKDHNQFGNNDKKSNKNSEKVIFNHDQDKFNIHYIKTDSINFGNININVNNNETNNIFTSHSSFNNLDIHKKNVKIMKEEFNEYLNEEGQSPEFKNKKSDLTGYNCLINVSNTYKHFSNTITNTKRTSSSPVLSNLFISIFYLDYSVISVVIFSTWGNLEKFGITEVQIFDNKNQNIDIIECHVFNGSEEGIWKIHNGKYHTVDENDMWISLLPNNNSNMKLEICFDASYDVGKLVIWNYNGRDITKGAKEIEVFKKNISVWRGFINKGCFNIKTDYSSKIFLSSDVNNKNNIESNQFNQTFFDISNFDKTHFYKNRPMKKKLSSNVPINLNNGSSLLREDMTNQDDEIIKSSLHNTSKKLIVNRKDLNSARNNNSNLINLEEGAYESNALKTSIENDTGKYTGKLKNKLSSPTHNINKDSILNSTYIKFSRIKIILSSNYGSKQFVGLTGIQFLDEKEESINIEKAYSIGAMPKDINTVNNNCGDPRIFENIFNNINETTDDYYMWLTVFDPLSPPFIELAFESPITMSSIKIWNYNNPLKLDRCTKNLEIIFDENYTTQQTVILRQGISEDNIDYSQTISFPIASMSFTAEELEPLKPINTRYASEVFFQDYETPYMPSGFMFKIKIISTWGDNHYVGLNGIEFFDQLGNSIFKSNNPRVIATPTAVSEISGMEDDVRHVNNLINGFNNSSEGRNSWLSPFINTNKNKERSMNLNNTFSNMNVQEINSDSILNNNKSNVIFFIFNKIVSLSYIQFWNYSKMPERGAKEIHIYCDDKIIYKGYIRKAPLSSTKNFNHSNSGSKQNSTIILFTCDENITKNININLLTHCNDKHEYAFKEKINSNLVEVLI